MVITYSTRELLFQLFSVFMMFSRSKVLWSVGYLPNIVSKAFLDLFFPVKTQVKFEEKTRQEIFKEEKTNGRLTVREKQQMVSQVFPAVTDDFLFHLLFNPIV